MPTYCTYITIYSGNRLPPFYLGATTIERIQKGYRGSVRSKRYQQIWDDEVRYNAKAFKTKIIKIYNSQQEARDAERRLITGLNAVLNPLYINLGNFPHIPQPYCDEKERSRRSASAKAQWEDPIMRDKMLKAIRKRVAMPEIKQSRSKAAKLRFANPKLRAKISAALTNKPKTAEHCLNNGLSRVGVKRAYNPDGTWYWARPGGEPR